MQPIQLGHIPSEATEAEPRVRPLSSAEAHMSRLRREFYETLSTSGQKYPYFHHEVEDPVAAGRLRALLGLRPLEGQQQQISKRIAPGGIPACEWQARIRSVLTAYGYGLTGEYICGSAASYVANRRLMVRGLSLLAMAKIVTPGENYDELSRRIRRLPFSYGDLDLNMEVNAVPTQALREALLAIPRTDGVQIEVKGPNKFLIVSISDSLTGERLDISLYQDRESPYLVQRDSLRVRIPTDPGKDNFVSYDCPDLWGYWRGQVLRESDRSADLTPDKYTLPKILDLATRKHCVTPWALEDACYDKWWTVVQKRSVAELGERVRVILADHATSDLGRQCYLLQWARVLKQHEAPQLNKHFEQLMLPGLTGAGGLPFLYECVRLLKRGGLQLLELAGLAALEEGWKHPLSGRLEHSDGRIFLRLRFRQEAEKCSVLLRYDPDRTLEELKSCGLKPSEITAALHLLWKHPIRCREQSDGFTQDTRLRKDITGKIRALFVGEPTASHWRDLNLSQQSSLAAVLLPQLKTWSELSDLGEQLLAERAGSDGDRRELCWAVVDGLIRDRAYITAAEYIGKLRSKGWRRPGGYVGLLTQILKSHTKATPELIQAACPDGVVLRDGKLDADAILRAADNPNVSASDFQELTQVFKKAPAKISPEMLVRLQECTAETVWVEWVRTKWKEDLSHSGLCALLTSLIVRGCEREIRLILPLHDPYFRNFVRDRNRFLGDDNQCAAVFERMLSIGMTLEQQEEMLRTWGLRDPKLWNRLMQSYLMRNGQRLEPLPDQDAPELESWNAVLSLADPAHALQLLQGQLKDREPPGEREAFVAALLSRWNNVRPSAVLLTTLLPRVNWNAIVDEVSPERVLFALLKADHLLLGSYLLAHVKPDQKQCEYVYRAWRDSLKRQPGLLRHPIVLQGVRLAPQFMWTNCLNSVPAEDLWPFATELGLHDKDITVSELTVLMRAALKGDPSGHQAMAIENQFSKGNHSSADYRAVRVDLAITQLCQHQGDLRFAIKVYNFTASESLCKRFPGEQQLVALLRHGEVNWVAALLAAASDDELATLSHAFYLLLLDRHLPRKPELSVQVLSHPPREASFLRDHWANLCRSQKLDGEARSTLILQQARYRADDQQLTTLLGELLESMRVKREVCSAELTTLLTDRLPRLPRSQALGLWNALSHTNHAPIHSLLDAALHLAEAEPLPDSLVTWIIQHSNSARREALSTAILDGRTQWTPEQLENQLLPHFLSKHYWDGVWAIAARYPQLNFPPPVEGMPFHATMTTYIDRTLAQPTYSAWQCAALHAIVYQLSACAQLFDCITQMDPKEIDDPLQATVLAFALRPDLDVAARRVLASRLRCPLALPQEPSVALYRRPELKGAFQMLIEVLPDSYVRRGLIVKRESERLSAMKTLRGSQVTELIRLMIAFYGRAAGEGRRLPAEEVHSGVIAPLIALIDRCPKDERQEPVTQMLRLAMLLPRTADSYRAIRILLLRGDGEGDCTNVAAFQYIPESIVAMQPDYIPDETDRLWLDHHGQQMALTRGMLSVGIQRRFCAALLASEKHQSRIKRAFTTLMRSRIALGVWHGMDLANQQLFWNRGILLCLDSILKESSLNQTAKLGQMLVEVFVFVQGRVALHTALELCSRWRRHWLELSTRLVVSNHLSLFLKLFPQPCESDNKAQMRVAHEVLLQGCKDILSKYPDHVAEIIDALFDMGWLPGMDKESTDKVIHYLVAHGRVHPQRPNADQDVMTAQFVVGDARLGPVPNSAAERVAAIGHDANWASKGNVRLRMRELTEAWHACATQETHRYVVCWLGTLTVRALNSAALSDVDRPSAAEQIATILRHAHTARLSEALLHELAVTAGTLCNHAILDDYLACLKEVFPSDKAPHYGGLAVHGLIKDVQSCLKHRDATLDLMPAFCKAITQTQPHGYCGPMGPITESVRNTLTLALRKLLIFYTGRPQRAHEYRQCVETLVFAISETAMSPETYNSTLESLLQAVKKYLDALNDLHDAQLLSVTLDVLRPLLGDESPIYGSTEKLHELFADLESCGKAAVQTQGEAGLPATVENLDDLVTQGDHQGAVTLWNHLNTAGELEGWNRQWELLLAASRTSVVGVEALAHECLYVLPTPAQAAQWRVAAPDFVKRVRSPYLRKELIGHFIERREAIPPDLLQEFCRLSDRFELWFPSTTRCFLGPLWKNYYPHAAERCLSQPGVQPLRHLWAGWIKFLYHGGDPDALGITRRLINIDLSNGQVSPEPTLLTVIDIAYRKRTSEVYGDLEFLWLCNAHARSIDYWEQLLEDPSVQVRSVNPHNRIAHEQVAWMIHQQPGRCFKLLNESRHRGWIDDSLSQKVISRIAQGVGEGSTFMNQLFEIAKDPALREEAETQIKSLIELLELCVKDAPKIPLVYLINALRDRTDSLEHEWIYDRIASLCSEAIVRTDATSPADPVIDEALYSFVQVLVHRTYWTKSGENGFLSVFRSGWREISLLWRQRTTWQMLLRREALFAGRQEGMRVLVPTPNITRCTRLLWLCCSVPAATSESKGYHFLKSRVAIMQLPYEAQKAADFEQLLAAWRTMLPWMKNLWQQNINRDLVEALEELLLEFLCGTQRKQTTIAKLEHALAVVFDFIIKDAAKLDQVTTAIKPLANSAGKRNDIFTQIRDLVIDELKARGQDDAIVPFRRSLAQ